MQKRRVYSFFWFSLILISISLALAVWQVYRLQWKNELIETLELRLSTPATTLPTAVKEGKIESEKELRYLHLKLEGTFATDKTILQIGRDGNGIPGYHVLVPVITTGGWVLVNLGNIKFTDKPDIDGLRLILANNKLPNSVTGFARRITEPEWFVPDNPKNFPVVLSIIVEEIAETIDLDPTQAFPFVLWADEEILPATVIDSVPSWTLDIANNHIEYAITWFAIAFGILLVSILWLRQNNFITRKKK